MYSARQYITFTRLAALLLRRIRESSHRALCTVGTALLTTQHTVAINAWTTQRPPRTPYLLVLEEARQTQVAPRTAVGGRKLTNQALLRRHKERAALVQRQL